MDIGVRESCAMLTVGLRQDTVQALRAVLFARAISLE